MAPDPKRVFTLRTDGAARGNPGPAGIGVILEDPGGVVVAELAEGIGWATNNVAEYRALLAGLELARTSGVGELVVFSDSLLLVQQMKGEFRVKHKGLKPLYEKARELVSEFDRVRFEAVRRELNAGADALANQGIDDWIEANPSFAPPPKDQEPMF